MGACIHSAEPASLACHSSCSRLEKTAADPLEQVRHHLWPPECRSRANRLVSHFQELTSSNRSIIVEEPLIS